MSNFCACLLLLADAAIDGSGTAANQYYLLVAVTTLAGVTIYLHKSNQDAAKTQAAADLSRFNGFVKHHEELILKIDAERTAMTIERISRIEMLIDLVSQNAVSTAASAAAGAKQADALDRLSDLLRERLAPLEPQQKRLT